jgi:hypothetical protein
MPFTGASLIGAINSIVGGTWREGGIGGVQGHTATLGPSGADELAREADRLSTVIGVAPA